MDHSFQLTVATFNCEWRRSSSRDASLIRHRLGDADIICLTEAYRDFFADVGHVLEPPHTGDREDTGRRKVLLWSRWPWAHIEHGTGDLQGNFLAARTGCPETLIDVMGVVIPYRFSGVRYGTPKRAVWERHLRFLEALQPRLSESPARSIIMGDFNQRIPRKYQPPHIFEALDRTVLKHFSTATTGIIEGIGKQAIDHICHSPDLKVLTVDGLSNLTEDGRQISDHFGLRARLRLDV